MGSPYNCPKQKNPFIKASIAFVSLLIFFFGVNQYVFATSETINFQGKIVRNDAGNEGLNIVAGTPACVVAGAGNDICDFRVNYFDAVTGGSTLASEVFTNIEIGEYNGIFNLVLGEGTFTAGTESSFTNVFLNNPNAYVSIEFAPDGSTYTETFLDGSGNRMGVRAAAYAISAKGANEQFQFDVANDETGYSGVSEGQIFFDGDDNVLRIYDGSQWQAVQAGSTSSFTDITGGTNITAAMIMGTGSSLTYSGTGTINSSSLEGLRGVTIAESLRAQSNLTGGGTISVDGSSNVKWTQRFITIANGRGSHFSTSGYFNIDMPTSGTLTGVGGAASRSWSTSGVLLGVWEALYYILPVGSGSASLAANFRVAYYTADLEVPADWILVAIRNNDNQIIRFGNGIQLRLNEGYDTTSYSTAFSPNSDLLDGQNGSYYLDDTNYTSWTLQARNAAASDIGNSLITTGDTAAFRESGTIDLAWADDEITFDIFGNSIGDTQLMYDTGQHLTTTSNVQFQYITSTTTGGQAGIEVFDGGVKTASLIDGSVAGNVGYLDLYSAGSLTTRLAGSGDSYFMGGDVGIGTTNPDVLLDLSRDHYKFFQLDRTANANVDTVFGGGVSYFGVGQDYMYLGVDGNNNQFIIDDEGDVGIGVQDPLAFLGVKAATIGSAQVNLVSSTGTNPSIPNNGDLWWNGTNLYFFDGSSSVDLLVGSSVSSLFTDGAAATYLTNTSANFALGGTDSSAPFYFDEGNEVLALTNTTTGASFRVNDQAGDTTPFLIDQYGNVGVGTSSPITSLDVNGGVKFGAKSFGVSDSGTARWAKLATLSLESQYDHIFLDLLIQSRYTSSYMNVEVACGSTYNGISAESFDISSITGNDYTTTDIIIGEIDTGSAYQYDIWVNTKTWSNVYYSVPKQLIHGGVGVSSVEYYSGIYSNDPTTTEGYTTTMNPTKHIATLSNGNVGIGVESPSAKLEIGGATSSIVNTSGDITLNSASGNISFAGDKLINTSGVEVGGDIEVTGGQIRLGNYASNPTSIGEGSIVYNTSNDKLYYDTSSGWIEVGDNVSGSANQTMRYDGSSWVGSSVLTNDGTNISTSGDLTIGGGELFLTPLSASTSTAEGSIYYDSDDDKLFVYANGAYERIATDMTKYSENNVAVANGAYVEVAHNQGTNDILVQGWVYDTSKYIEVDTNYSIEQTDNNTVRLYNNSGSTQNLRLEVVVFGADIAEWYTVDNNIVQAGDIVASTGALDSYGVPIVSRSDTESDMLGVISTKAGKELGLPGENRRLLALSGRIEVKVSTLDGGITVGDRITSSPIVGVGMKATSSGQVVGRSMEETLMWDMDKCIEAESYESIDWNEQGIECYRVPVLSFTQQQRELFYDEYRVLEEDYLVFGKLLVFADLGWYQPQWYTDAMNSMLQTGGISSTGSIGWFEQDGLLVTYNDVVTHKINSTYGNFGILNADMLNIGNNSFYINEQGDVNISGNIIANSGSIGIELGDSDGEEEFSIINSDGETVFNVDSEGVVGGVGVVRTGWLQISSGEPITVEHMLDGIPSIIDIKMSYEPNGEVFTTKGLGTDYYYESIDKDNLNIFNNLSREIYIKLTIQK